MLTCLTPALYTDENGNEVENWSDPEVGLHAQTKSGEVLKVVVPKDCLIIQIGEALEIKTGGFIKALPHTVIPFRARKDEDKKYAGKLSRNSMAVFIDPTHQNPLDLPRERSEKQLFECDTVQKLLTPKLQGRW